MTIETFIAYDSTINSQYQSESPSSINTPKRNYASGTRMSEFDKLMDRAGAFPYRKYGHIRVAFKQKLTKPRVVAVINAIKAHANRRAKDWNFPDNETLKVWKDKNYISEYVCDDPQPIDCSPEVDGFWILKFVDRYDFRLVLDGDKMKGEPKVGHDMKVIKDHLPKWLIELTKVKADDIIKALNEQKGFGG